ncbi:hypothetical protein OAV88_01410 [bacterium]|nr:hypothetical protein [bacterium]
MKIFSKSLSLSLSLSLQCVCESNVKRNSGSLGLTLNSLIHYNI